MSVFWKIHYCILLLCLLVFTWSWKAFTWSLFSASSQPLSAPNFTTEAFFCSPQLSCPPGHSNKSKTQQVTVAVNLCLRFLSPSLPDTASFVSEGVHWQRAGMTCSSSIQMDCSSISHLKTAVENTGKTRAAVTQQAVRGDVAFSVVCRLEIYKCALPSISWASP